MVKKTYYGAALLVGVLGLATGLYAQTPEEILRIFRQYQEVNVSLSVPTVLEIPFQQGFERPYDVAVMDQASMILQPFLVRQQKSLVKYEAMVGDTPFPALVDDNNETSSDFDLPEAGEGRVDISVRTATPLTSSQLLLTLEAHVALPRFVEIRAMTDAGSKIVVAYSRMQGLVVPFPKTTATSWTISFTYAQPLRIAELSLQDDAQKIEGYGVRFLAQPSHSYRMYVDADRFITQHVPEGGNLSVDEGVRRLAPSISLPNSFYAIADIDADTVPDIHDNCVDIANTDQQDVDSNGRGDACDDFDRDGRINVLDNCPNMPNRYQEDTDGDKVGDVCDSEESRVTERYAWLPWLGIGGASLVVILLFALTVRSKPPQASQ